MSLDKDLDATREWQIAQPSRSYRAARAGVGLLRITLLFGSIAVALAMIAVPLLEGNDREHGAAFHPAGVDIVTTGSVGQGGYTVRRSVLQRSSDAVCIIRADGTRSGDC